MLDELLLLLEELVLSLRTLCLTEVSMRPPPGYAWY